MLKLPTKFLIISGLALVVFISSTLYASANSKAPIVKGYAEIREGSSIEKYRKTKIKSYPPESVFVAKTTTFVDSQPEISGTSGFVADMKTGQILFSKNPESKAKIASLTKIMTAIVSLEHLNLSAPIKVSSTAASVGENSMSISENEIYSLEELLHGLMLNSGNDAAYAIAEGVAGDVDTFVSWMNYKASELGLENTKFEDPSGLNDNTYSTVLDLFKLSRYALKFPELRQIVKTLDYEIEGTEEHKYLYLENQTNLLRTYPGVEGIKTGYTEEAGLCLATYAQNDATELIGVVVGSIDRKGDMILMLDHSFSSLGIKVEHNLLD